MVSADRRDTKVTWRRRSMATGPNVDGERPVSQSEDGIWVQWMELGGSERDGNAVLSLPGTRVVAYADSSDQVRVQDSLLYRGDVYDVMNVVELHGRVGYRLELERNATVR